MRKTVTLESVQKVLETLALFCYESVCDTCVFCPFCEQLRIFDIASALEEVCRDVGNDVDEILAQRMR